MCELIPLKLQICSQQYYLLSSCSSNFLSNIHIFSELHKVIIHTEWQAPYNSWFRSMTHVWMPSETIIIESRETKFNCTEVTFGQWYRTVKLLRKTYWGFELWLALTELHKKSSSVWLRMNDLWNKEFFSLNRCLDLSCVLIEFWWCKYYEQVTIGAVLNNK